VLRCVSKWDASRPKSLIGMWPWSFELPLFWFPPPLLGIVIYDSTDGRGYRQSPFTCWAKRGLGDSARGFPRWRADCAQFCAHLNRQLQTNGGAKGTEKKVTCYVFCYMTSHHARTNLR
jgi:hypothetical protein